MDPITLAILAGVGVALLLKPATRAVDAVENLKTGKCDSATVNAGVQGLLQGTAGGAATGISAGPAGAGVGAAAGAVVGGLPLLLECGPNIEKKLREMFAKGSKEAGLALARLDAIRLHGAQQTIKPFVDVSHRTTHTVEANTKGAVKSIQSAGRKLGF